MTLDENLALVDPVRIGAGRGTPDRFVTVANDGEQILRLDIFAGGLAGFPFEAAVVWRDHVFVGLGDAVHAVSIVDRSVASIAMGSYFESFYPTQDYLLVASAQRLIRLRADRSIAWTSDMLGIDGVVVRQPHGPVIRGEGEWDPPGGWKPFAVLATTGKSTEGAG